MPETLSELEARRDKLQRIIDNAVDGASNGPQNIRYRPLADMQRIIDDIDARIAALDPSQKKSGSSIRMVRINYDAGVW